jgi:two-component system chemotaxis response regulator CheB
MAQLNRRDESSSDCRKPVAEVDLLRENARLAEQPKTPRTVIVIGGSAGGLEALQRVLTGVDGNLHAAVFVVIHTPAGAAHVLAAILQRASKMKACYPTDGEPLVGGRIDVGVPDHHLLIERGAVRITKGPRENGFRPAVDPLFRTAAAAYDRRVIGIVLSGGQNDGTLGMAAIKRAGGITVAQSPDDALVSSMPASAIANVGVDHVLTADQIRTFLLGSLRETGKKVMARRAKQHSPGASTRERPDPAAVGAALPGAPPSEPPSMFVCPDCGGTLWEAEENGVLRYRCHVGHAYTAESLLDQQAETLEQAMWTALRSLEEGAALRARMADRARDRGMQTIADRYDEQSVDLKQRAAIVRKALVIDRETPIANRPAQKVEAQARRARKR